MRRHFMKSFARILAWSILSGSAVTAWADETPEPKNVAEELLEILRASGTINDSQYLDLSERAREEEVLRSEAVDEAIETATLPAVSAAPSPEPGPTDWKFKWSDGFKLERNDGAFKLKFGGRIQTGSRSTKITQRSRDFARIAVASRCGLANIPAPALPDLHGSTPGLPSLGVAILVRQSSKIHGFATRSKP
jgi:hypothetical protein